jgi:hypothetical protein
VVQWHSSSLGLACAGVVVGPNLQKVTEAGIVMVV